MKAEELGLSKLLTLFVDQTHRHQQLFVQPELGHIELSWLGADDVHRSPLLTAQRDDRWIDLVVTQESQGVAAAGVSGVMDDQGEPQVLTVGRRRAGRLTEPVAPTPPVPDQLDQHVVGAQTDFGVVARPDREAPLEWMSATSLDVGALHPKRLEVEGGSFLGRLLEDHRRRIDVGLSGRRHGEQEEQPELAQHRDRANTQRHGRKAKRRTVSALALVASLLVSGEAEAQTYATSELVGLSSARIALGTDTDALFVNPAGLASSRKYLARLEYGDDFRDEDRRFHASITDGQTGPVAGGLAVTYGVARPRGPGPDVPGPAELLHRGFRIDGALAVRAGDRVRLGVAGRGFLFNLKDGDEVVGDGPRRFTVDVGLQAQLSDQVYLGLVGRNLTKPDDPETPLQAGGGLGLKAGLVDVEADLLYDDFTQNLVFLTGTRLLFAEVASVRVGTEYDAEQEEFGMGFGAGVQIGRLGIEAGYAQRFTNLDFKSDDERIFSAGLTLEVF
jgi:hypothetical protein